MCIIIVPLFDYFRVYQTLSSAHLVQSVNSTSFLGIIEVSNWNGEEVIHQVPSTSTTSSGDENQSKQNRNKSDQMVPKDLFYENSCVMTLFYSGSQYYQTLLALGWFIIKLCQNK